MNQGDIKKIKEHTKELAEILCELDDIYRKERFSNKELSDIEEEIIEDFGDYVTTLDETIDGLTDNIIEELLIQKHIKGIKCPLCGGDFDFWDRDMRPPSSAYRIECLGCRLVNFHAAVDNPAEFFKIFKNMVARYKRKIKSAKEKH